MRRRKKKKNKNQKCLPYVEVKNNHYERAISEFKKRVKNSGMLLELRNREFYEKKSAARRRKKKLAILRNKYNTID
jgi:small subunit ribosomal protein S21